jgi:DNA repair exonuclease SbcCD nuclease subunit
MIRLVITADNHLGRYYGKMSLKQLSERRAHLREAFSQVVDFAIAKKAHLFLQCGDLFDREAPPPAELTFVAQQFQKLREAGIRIYAISGNHDMPTASDGATPVRIYDALRAVHVFTKRTQIEFDFVKVEGQTVAIGGIAPDPRLEPNADPLEGVTYNAPSADVAILLLHGGFEGHVPPDFGDVTLTKARVAAMNGIDYYFIGDIHRTAKEIVGEATIVIPGASERMNFGELKEKAGFYYAELDGKKAIKLTHQSIEPQAMLGPQNQDAVIRTTDIPADKPTEYVFEKLRALSDKEQLLQLRIEGPIKREVYHRLKFFDIWRLGNELNFYFDLDRAGVELERDEQNAGAGGGQVVSIRDEIANVAAEMADSNRDERAVIEEAREMVLGRLGREE